MRINQAKIYLNFFRQLFLQKYRFNNYVNRDEPCYFFGCYSGAYNTIKNHKGFAVISWCGSDGIELTENPDFAAYLQNHPEIFHIAETKYISDDLTKCGIPHFVYPLAPINLDNISPKPIGKNVYVYSSHTNPEFYGASIIERIKKKLPHIKFITRYATAPDCATKDELMKIYEDSCIGLRLVRHDGMSCTVAEMGMMGRKMVWNADSPNAIPWETDEDIINAIKSEYARAGQTDEAMAHRMEEFLTIPEEIFDMEFYKRNHYACSVIINTYKDDINDLSKAIDSYLQQKYVDVELIISTVAGDPAITLAKSKGIKKIVVNKTPGIYSQLNEAIKHITTDFWCYASGNDKALPEKCFREINLLKNSKKKICYSAFYCTDENFNIGSTRKFHDYDWDKHLQGNFVSDCSMISMDITRKYGPFKEKFGNVAFYDFWLRVFEGEGDVFLYNPAPTWLYKLSHKSQHIAVRADEAKMMQRRTDRENMLKLHAL